MKFFDASRYASPLRKALDKKENAPRNLRFETLENRALLSVTPLDNLEAVAASAEIAPAQTDETPVVDLTAFAVSNATTENVFETESNDTLETANDLGTLTETTTVEAIAGAHLNKDYYKVEFIIDGTNKHSIVLDGAWFKPTADTSINLQLKLYDADGNLKLYGSAGRADTKSISLEGIAAGTYYIGVEQANNGEYSDHEYETAYTLTITPPNVEPDQYEDNDALATATDLGACGAKTINASTELHQEMDYFKFSTPADSTAEHYVKMSFARNVANANLAFSLFDAAGNELANDSEITTSKTFSLEGLPAGDYYVRVYNVDEGAKSAVDYALEIAAPQVAPAAPADFAFSGDLLEDEPTKFKTNEATLTWGNVFGEEGYKFRYSTDGGETWTDAGTVDANVTTHTFGLQYGKTYKYQVCATNRYGDSEWRTVEFETIAAPAAPVVVAGTLVPVDQTVTLTWTADKYAFDGYRVEKLGEDGFWAPAHEGQLPAGAESWTTDKLELGASYKYRVVAKNNAGESFSAEIEFANPNVPTPTDNLLHVLNKSANPTVTLTWDAVVVETENEYEAVSGYVVTVYEVVESEVEGEEPTLVEVETQTVAEATCTTGELNFNGKYCVKVEVANAYGKSEGKTTEIFAVGSALTVAPSLVLVDLQAASQPTATVKWTQVEGATSYYVAILDAEGEVVYEIDDFAVEGDNTPT
ncbi:MAG: fibronectin type III domain-containing protein, partial [Thermoguttaceae bacterium]|nr:fibronectin type III domain-containing protein [Thermoguttaceae bacterium]